MPPLFAERPILYDDCLRIWESFWILSSARSYNGAGPNPVAISEILAYNKVFKIDTDEKFLIYICQMDRRWLNHWNKSGKDK